MRAECEHCVGVGLNILGVCLSAFVVNQWQIDCRDHWVGYRYMSTILKISGFGRRLLCWQHDNQAVDRNMNCTKQDSHVRNFLEPVAGWRSHFLGFYTPQCGHNGCLKGVHIYLVSSHWRSRLTEDLGYTGRRRKLWRQSVHKLV